MVFCRIDAQATRTREAMTQHDVLIVQDPTLLYQVELFAGLLREGYLLINSPFSLDELGMGECLKSMPSDHVCVVPVLDIGFKHMRRPIANTPLLGAFAVMTGVIDLASVQSAVRQKFMGSLSEANAAAAKDRYDYGLTCPFEERNDKHHARRAQIEGSQTVAEAVVLCRREVIAAYPISPQTHVVELLSRMIK
jgi:pyruvate ferredoxin oxidoreductase gamma subunit